MSKRKRNSRRKRIINKGALAPPRNPLFNHPLMKKSHVHDKSYKAKRRAEKVQFARDGYSQSGFYFFAIKTFLRIFVPETATMANHSNCVNYS